MDERRIPAFSGIAGQVVLDAFSIELFLNGILIALAVGVPAAVAASSRSGGMIALALLWGLFCHCLVVARFAQQGVEGESSGFLVSSLATATWGGTMLVALRYLTLWIIWSLPLIFMGMITGLTALGKPPAQPPFPISLYSLTMLLAPPVFLSVAAGAGHFAEMFSPDLWRSLFSGRWGDLFLMGILFFGSLFLPIFLVSPAFSLIGPANIKTMAFLGAVLLGVLLVLSATLQGRLCGFFVRQLVAPPETSTAAPRYSPAGGPVPLGGGRPSGPAPAVFEGSPLADADQRLQTIREQFQAEPQAALRALENLHSSYAPNPKVLHALCQARQLTGDGEGAVAAAREGIPLCMTHGQTNLAVDMLRATLPQARALDLPPIQLLPVIEALEKTGEARAVVHAYAALVMSHPNETRAVKGMLRAAEQMLRRENAAEDAAKVYKFLLHHCPGSPLAVFMQEGLSEAERRLTRT